MRQGQTVLVAYSGGADSTFLLATLAELSAEWQFDVVAGHLHHGQRSEADAELVGCQAYCDSLEVPLVTGKADVPEMAKVMRIGLEEAGRNARYTFLSQAARGFSATAIATGHTLDDHVETVLVNLLRGTGLAGLAGIPEIRGEIVRPILFVRRAETRAFCKERGLWFHDDPANLDPTHLRSRIRSQVTPLLEGWDAGFTTHVQRLAHIAEEENAFMDGVAAGLLEKAESPLNGPLRFLTQDLEARFERATLLHAPGAMVKRAVRLAAQFAEGPLDYRQTQIVHDGLVDGGSGSVTTEGGRAIIEWDAETLDVRTAYVESPFRYPLVVPGETESDVFGFRIVAQTGPDTMPADRTYLEVALDYATLKGNLHLRSAETGDRIAPVGLAGTKKLTDLFQESRLTMLARRRLPIICDMVGPVWVPGCALANRVKVTGTTTRVLRLTLEPIQARDRQDS